MIRAALQRVRHSQLALSEAEWRRHLTPPYDPWDQRLCVSPDGDFFDALAGGRASICTGTIAKFTATGLTMESGEAVHADLVVKATGFRMELPFERLELSVDGSRRQWDGAFVSGRVEAMLSPHVALLDLFGFENFERNSFEQLAINYANEKLQLQLNLDVFDAALAEAEAEGVDLGASASSYTDNSACIALLEGGGAGGKPGLLALLNEECALGDGTDANFVLKASQLHKASEHFYVPSVKMAARTSSTPTACGTPSRPPTAPSRP